MRCLFQDKTASSPPLIPKNYGIKILLWFELGEIVQSLKWLAIDWMTKAQFPVEEIFFCSPLNQDFTLPPVQWVLGVKQPKHKPEHSPLCNAEVKNIWSFTFTPPVCLLSVVLRHMGNFFCNLLHTAIKELKKHYHHWSVHEEGGSRFFQNVDSFLCLDMALYSEDSGNLKCHLCPYFTFFP